MRRTAAIDACGERGRRRGRTRGVVAHHPPGGRGRRAAADRGRPAALDRCAGEVRARADRAGARPSPVATWPRQRDDCRPTPAPTSDRRMRRLGISGRHPDAPPYRSAASPGGRGRMRRCAVGAARPGDAVDSVRRELPAQVAQDVAECTTRRPRSVHRRDAHRRWSRRSMATWRCCAVVTVSGDVNGRVVVVNGDVYLRRGAQGLPRRGRGWWHGAGRRLRDGWRRGARLYVVDAYDRDGDRIEADVEPLPLDETAWFACWRVPAPGGDRPSSSSWAAPRSASRACRSGGFSLRQPQPRGRSTPIVRHLFARPTTSLEKRIAATMPTSRWNWAADAVSRWGRLFDDVASIEPGRCAMEASVASFSCTATSATGQRARRRPAICPSFATQYAESARRVRPASTGDSRPTAICSRSSEWCDVAAQSGRGRRVDALRQCHGDARHPQRADESRRWLARAWRSRVWVESRAPLGADAARRAPAEQRPRAALVHGAVRRCAAVHPHVARHPAGRSCGGQRVVGR